ncbi:MAG TPA: hypothetical protein VEN81_01065, partial [Planctomycetota bacterium]|nr:hypothetical protein [Planctomycetota bacterium]
LPRKSPRRMSKLTLAIAATAGAFGILLAILVVVLMDRHQPLPPDSRASRESHGPKEPPLVRESPPQDPAPPRAPVPGNPASGALPAAKAFIDYDHQIEQVVARCNLAGIVATVLLHSNRAPEHDELQDRIRAYDRELKMLVAKRAEQTPGIADAVVPSHFEGGDRIVAFAGKTLDPLNTAPFAEDLKAWLGRFRAGVSEQAILFRDSLSMPLEMRFPERTKELSALTVKLGVILGDSRGPEPAPVSSAASADSAAGATSAAPAPVEAFPPLLVAELRSRLASVHPYYRSLLGAEDSARLDALAVAARGTMGDFEFVKFRVLPLLNRGAVEYAEFGGRVADLEPKLIEGGTAVDILHFKDGRKLEGSLEEETEETVKLRSRFGSVKFPRSEIARIEKGKGSGVELRARYAAAKGKKEELLALGIWCKDHGLTQGKELAWWSVLLLDPGQERCRAELGLEKTPGASDPTVQVKDGKIEWNGKTYTFDELRRELESLGYVLLNGVWCEKVVRTFKIDNLYKDEGKYLILGSGPGVRTRTENREETVYSVATKSWGTRTKQVTLGRYIGGGPPNGTVHLQIDSPGDLIECRVKARSQVARTGDSVTVSVVADPSDLAPKVLYSLSAPGELWPTYDASDKVRGLPRFCIRAQVTGGGMFLPCDSTTQGVLEVRFTYGKPLERLNDTLGARREGAPLGLNPAAPAPVRKTGNLRVEEVVNGAAESACARPTLGEVMAEMRRVTDGLVYTREVTAPIRFSQLAVAIHDPLAPRLEELPQAEQTLMTSWFGGLGQSDRKEFAIFYGLWCCRTRYIQRPSGR